MTACSVLGERLGEDLAASAPNARRFLLLEQPGPWTGRNAITHSDLDVDLGRALMDRTDAADVKVHLIRRSSRRTALETAFVLSRGRRARWVERHELTDPAEVLEIDLEGRASAGSSRSISPARTASATRAAPAAAGRWRAPCAPTGRSRRGRSATSAATGSRRRCSRSRTGSRSGACPPRPGREIVSALERGEIVLEHLRGRAGDPWAVQAADVLVRRRLDLRGLDALAVDASTAASSHCGRRRWHAACDGRPPRGPAPRPISCGDEPETVPAYELVDLSLMRAMLLDEPGKPLRAAMSRCPSPVAARCCCACTRAASAGPTSTCATARSRPGTCR